MAHILEIIDPAIRQRLYSMNIGPIYTNAYFNGLAKVQTGTTLGGFPIFSTSPQEVIWDVSKLIERGTFKMNLSKPSVPSQGLISQFIGNKATLTLLNPSNQPYAATTQDGAIIDLTSIEQGEFIIEASFGQIGPRLPLFIGRIEGPPNESRNKTVFTLYDVTWEYITNPVIFENFGQVNGTGVQGGYSDAFNFVNRSVFVPTQIDGFRAYGGNITFNEEGQGITTIENENAEQLDIKRIGIQNGAKPGQYRIEFQSDTNFTITYPDNEERQGSILTDFNFGAIDIYRLDWIGNDGTDVVITFQVFAPNVTGNPISIIRNLIEKTFLLNYGELPGTNPAYNTVPVLWSTFDELEREFKGLKVWVSETVKDNNAWKLETGKLPITYIKLAQKIADHCGCSILINEEGLIKIQGPRTYDGDVYDLNGTFLLPEYTIKGPKTGKKDNILISKYAFNGKGESYGVTSTLDTRNDPTSEKPVRFNFPMNYFKYGESVNAVEWLLAYWRERLINHPVSYDVKVTSNFHLSAQPGDRYRLILPVQPVRTSYVECVGVKGKSPGINGTLELVEIMEPEGEAFALCKSRSGDLVW